MRPIWSSLWRTLRRLKYQWLGTAASTAGSRISDRTSCHSQEAGAEWAGRPVQRRVTSLCDAREFSPHQCIIYNLDSQFMHILGSNSRREQSVER